MRTAINETYGSLLMQTRPHVIQDDEDNARFIDLLEALVNQDTMTAEQEELVGVLRLLVDNYEKRIVIVPGITQAEIVQHLMKANNLAAHSGDKERNINGSQRRTSIVKGANQSAIWAIPCLG